MDGPARCESRVLARAGSRRRTRAVASSTHDEQSDSPPPRAGRQRRRPRSGLPRRRGARWTRTWASSPRRCARCCDANRSRVAPTASIRDAAVLMREQRVSSVLVVDEDRLFGIVTDRDLRNRVIAPGLGTDGPIIDIATVAPLTIDLGATAFEALLLMARSNVHHVPVMDGARVAGMITATDLTEHHSTSAVFLAGEIYKQASVEGLQRASTRIRNLQRNLAAADATALRHRPGDHRDHRRADDPAAAARRGAVRSAAGRLRVGRGRLAGAQRADREERPGQLHGAQRRLRRGACTASTSTTLSRYVCAGLDACGYVFCPGEMMAMTGKWRQPLRSWKQYFREVDRRARADGADADLRLLRPAPRVRARGAGRRAPRQDFLRRAKGNGIFLAYMVGNALSHQPPLNVFGKITHRAQGRAPRHDRPQAPGHRPDRRPGARLRAGRRARRRSTPRTGWRPRRRAARSAKRAPATCATRSSSWRSRGSATRCARSTPASRPTTSSR